MRDKTNQKCKFDRQRSFNVDLFPNLLYEQWFIEQPFETQEAEKLEHLEKKEYAGTTSIL